MTTGEMPIYSIEVGDVFIINEELYTVIYTDYDPRDWDYDLEALIVFNPLRDVKNFRLVRKKTT
jgi:hypothetical protein